MASSSDAAPASPSGSSDDLPPLVQPFLRQVLLEQPKFHSGPVCCSKAGGGGGRGDASGTTILPSSTIPGGTTTTTTTTATTDTSSSSESNNSNSKIIIKTVSSSSSSSSSGEEEAEPFVPALLEESSEAADDENDCASTSSSSLHPPRTPLSEKDDDERDNKQEDEEVTLLVPSTAAGAAKKGKVEFDATDTILIEEMTTTTAAATTTATTPIPVNQEEMGERTRVSNDVGHNTLGTSNPAPGTALDEEKDYDDDGGDWQHSIGIKNGVNEDENDNSELQPLPTPPLQSLQLPEPPPQCPSGADEVSEEDDDENDKEEEEETTLVPPAASLTLAEGKNELNATDTIIIEEIPTTTTTTSTLHTMAPVNPEEMGERMSLSNDVFGGHHIMGTSNPKENDDHLLCGDPVRIENYEEAEEDENDNSGLEETLATPQSLQVPEPPPPQYPLGADASLVRSEGGVETINEAENLQESILMHDNNQNNRSTPPHPNSVDAGGDGGVNREEGEGEEEEVSTISFFNAGIADKNPNTTTVPETGSSRSSEEGEEEEKRLDWSFLRAGVLYDRDNEIQALQTAFRRHIDHKESSLSPPPPYSCEGHEDQNQQQQQQQQRQQQRPSLVVVSGLSGTGKSALTKAALEPLVQERKGYFLNGKFDQLQHAEPYAPFVNAMNDYVYYVLQQQQYQNQYQHITSLNFLETLQTEILSALSPEGCSLLLQMIPSLSHLLHIDSPDASFHDHHHHHDHHYHATMHQFAGNSNNNSNNGTGGGLWEASQDRVKVVFRRFLRVICKPERPVVLVLDDLQWADTASLDLLESLVCDVQNNRGLFLVGICRSNEVSMDHNLANLLRQLEDEHNARIENVIAQNLTATATNQLICDVLKQPWDICLPLTEIIHAQTKGNVFYVMNYIKALHADNVLIPDHEYGTGGWLWDEERWQQLFNPHPKNKKWKRNNSNSSGSGSSNSNNSTSENHQNNDPNHLQQEVATHELPLNNNSELSPVVDLIARQLRRLPETTQLVLRTCACIGAEIDMALVQKVLIEVDIQSSIQSAVDEGLLLVLERYQEGCYCQRRTSEGEQHQEDNFISLPARRYMFAHDGIQQAAYSLIPESNKSATHLSVGRMLFKNMMSMEEFNDNVFVVVNQMNRGMSHIDDQAERDGLAALNLKAGNRAILSSDFHTAVQYFMVGTTLLAQSPHHWARQYELSLELYNSLAEAEYCVADFEMMDAAVFEVLENGLDFRDMIRAYATQVYALGARFMLQEAIDLGLQVLERFDETFSNPSPKRKTCMGNFSTPMKTKRKLRWKTKSQLLYMPDMNDPDKLAAMGILNLLTTYSLIGRPSLFPFIAARLVRLSLDHGLCAISAPGFAFFGLWLCSIGDPQSGYRYGTLSLDILERYQNTITEWVPRVYSVFYGWIAPWKQPLRSTFPHTLHAHRVGLETGDIEYSCIGAHVYSMNAFFAGMPLPELEVSMRKFVDLMNKHKQGPWAAATSVQLQLVHNLMGKSEDPLILRGDIMTDEKVLQIATVQNMESYETYFVQVMVWSLLLAYHFGKLRQALATANDCRQAVKDLGPSFLVCIQYFYDGMSALAAAADPRFERTKKQHMVVAKRALKKLQKVAKHCPDNCLHKVYLLQAEFAALRGDMDHAILLYNKSIALAHDNGFLQDEALAYERAGIALWHDNNNPRANTYLSRALDCFSLWGAEAKVDQLRRHYFT